MAIVSTAAGPSAHPRARPGAVPLDYPLRPPHMGSTHRKIRRGHLAPLPIRAHRAYLDSQIGGDVGGRPPLRIRVWAGSHRPIVSDAPWRWRSRSPTQVVEHMIEGEAHVRRSAVSVAHHPSSDRECGARRHPIVRSAPSALRLTRCLREQLHPGLLTYCPHGHGA